MPCIETVWRWKRDNTDFCKQYAIARQDQAEYISEECLELADNCTAEDVFVQRLRIDTRKWYAGKVHPRVYGDKQASAEVTVHNTVNNITISEAQKSEIQEARRLALEGMK